ncbi:hypothetical protein KAR91_87345, partial [Candidatus Pacearchaeota archaeon]|nr:hypothetical protein [Candidatus Pacearchaeota archaeon]
IYTYRICAYNTHGNSTWSVSADSPKPVAPTLSTIGSSDSLLNLSWTLNTELDFASYNLYKTTSPSQSYTKIPLGTTASYADNSVNNGSKYYYYVTAVDSSGNESLGSNLMYEVPRDSVTPTAPVIVSATGNDGTKTITVVWTDGGSDTDSAGFNIYRSTASGGTFVRIASGIGTTNYDDSLIVADETVYYYKVTESDTSGNESSFSGEVFADITPPRVPMNLTAISNGTQITVDWEASSDPTFANYEVDRATDGVNFTPNVGTPGTDQFIDSNVSSDGTLYTYKIRSVDTFSNTSGDSAVVTADITPPSAPTGLVASADNASVSLDWVDNSETDLAGYEVHRSTGGAFSKVASVPDSEFVDFTVTNSTTYQYKTSAIDTSTNSSVSFSNVESATPEAGKLHAVVTPQEAINGGAQWSIDSGSTWHASGETVVMQDALSPTVTFSDVTNWTTPADQLVPINGFTNVFGVYLDPLPPAPDPATFATAPREFNETSIEMIATAGVDADSPPVEYYFTETSGNAGGDDSGWQISRGYIDTGLTQGQTYSYTVKMRDSAGNETAASTPDSSVQLGVTRLYVSSGGDNSDGRSWATAFNHLQDALDVAISISGQDIWVAAGTYYPDEDSIATDGTDHIDNDQSESFVLVSGIELYGGFAGSETMLKERDMASYPVILSGFINQSDTEPMPNATHSQHVVTISSDVILDGFTIKGGYFDDTVTGDIGGSGILVNSGSPSISNCNFELNFAEGDNKGGAMYSAAGSNPTLINCLFVGNRASGNDAGAIYHEGGVLDLTNCTVVDNSGDGIHCASGTLNLRNCIVWHNRMVTNDLTNYPIREIILQPGVTANISYSNIENSQAGVLGGNLNWGDGNINIAPEFETWGYWEWRQRNGDDLIVDDTVFAVDPNQVTIYDFSHNAANFGEGGSSDEDYFVSDYLVNKKPYWDGVGGETSTLSNLDDFNLWWTEALNSNKGLSHYNLEVPWICKDDVDGVFELNSDHFFPFDTGALGSGDQSMADCTCTTCSIYDLPSPANEHNWYFTLQYHTTCRHVPGMTLYFKASDDLFVAINDRVIIERGGFYVNKPSETEITFNVNGTVTVHYIWAEPAKNDETYNFQLAPDSLYDFDLFYAQRHKNTYSDPVLIVQRTGSSNELTPYFNTGNYHLQAISPCIDAANNDAVPDGVVRDIDGIARFIDDPQTVDTGAPGYDAPYVDMGAYEYNPAYTAIDVKAGAD